MKNLSHQMSELCCQASIRLLHVHNFGVCSQNVELPKPDIKESINQQSLTVVSGAGRMLFFNHKIVLISYYLIIKLVTYSNI